MTQQYPQTYWPKSDWLANYATTLDCSAGEVPAFPLLHYKRIDEPLNSSILTQRQLQMGGSYNIFHELPFHDARCAIFENHFMPYELDGIALKVRNGVLLWPRMNLDAFTDIKDPKTVYMRQPYSDRRQAGTVDALNFVARIRFNADHIEIVETTNPQGYDESAERIDNLQHLQNVFQL